MGLILKGTVIEGTVIGGPAFLSTCLGRGDVVLEVDGRTVTEQTIEILLAGNDKPGSLVVLTVAKGNDMVSAIPPRVLKTRTMHAAWRPARLCCGLHLGRLWCSLVQLSKLPINR